MNFKTFLLSLTLTSFVNALIIPRQVEQDVLKVNELGAPSKEEAAAIARTLVNRESLMNVNTIRKNEEGVLTTPVSGMEYYADCDGDGDPYWLVVDIGSTYKNIIGGSPYTFTIRVGDHPSSDYVNPNYPGGISSSPAGSPRILLEGVLKEDLIWDPIELARIERCFLQRHPDSKWWLPSNLVTPHKSHWAKLFVEKVYMVGGFGDRAYIGDIDSEAYHSSSLLK